MKLLSAFLTIVFLLSYSPGAQEEENPLAGTTWELISAKNIREDTTITFPDSPYDQQIIIYGKTHYNIVSQDTSQDYSFSCTATYSIDGDNFTGIFKMFSTSVGIGDSLKLKFKIDGDQLIFKAANFQAFGYEWKEWNNVWKRID